MEVQIPEHLLESIDYVIDYVGNSSIDWFKIKLEIINRFPPKERSRFSRRHHSTKKHILNEFDKKVIKYWQHKTGNVLWIDPNKLHPADWVRRPHGWGLFSINEERRKKAEASNKKAG